MDMENKNSLQLWFLGGAGTVTGSKTLVEFRGKRILVDCGLFQGIKEHRLLNWKPLPTDPSQIDAILLTHAHLDHCGYLPVIVKQGFKGEIHCTQPTRELTELILRDSAKIQQEEAERANRYGYSRHDPARPLYTDADVSRAMHLFRLHPYGESVSLGASLVFRFYNSGHILGSSMIELQTGNHTLVFTGDLGRMQPLLLYPPESIEKADVLILESTYGDRNHPLDDPKEVLHDILWETYEKQGIVMIPTFAVERAQELLFLLTMLKMENRLPGMRVYLDSPMGSRATRLMLKFIKWHALKKDVCLAMDELVELVVDVEASKAVVEDSSPKIVLAGSGMLTGGRILFYLQRYAGQPQHTILLAGFQAAGTRGRALLEGARELKFFGSYHSVKCRVEQMDSLSAHADQEELLYWLRQFDRPPETILLNHGEPHQSNALRAKIQHETGSSCKTVQFGERFTIELAKA